MVSCTSAEEASPAIRPITVLSPVLNTTPKPVPDVQDVPKKATFCDSKMLIFFD